MAVDLIGNTHERGGVAGDRGVLGYNKSDRLTGVCDPLVMQGPKGRAWWSEDVSMPVIEPGRGRAILMCEDFQDTWNRKSRFSFDRCHPTLRDPARDHNSMRQPSRRVFGGIFRSAT